ncbi:3-hydroxyacyl-ACP dehydratase FabZ family protein [Rhodopila sp.]|uniref:3-hydroxyacyl-ACP dehydratase FabZ family protein n=1 Tax=Rhodopila sp. TaxID=2480087 RepID=UPI003D0EA628
MRLEYFQMVDRITRLDLESRLIAASCQVPDQSPVFEGHFPGHPILPGTLMIETMAQTGGWLILAMLRFTRMPFLMQVEKAKMRCFVPPGQLLTSEVSLLHDGSGYAVVKGSISTRDGALGDRKVADAEVRYGVVPFPNDRMRDVMLQAARRVGVPESLLDAA